jgi:hypothetical protein
MNNNEAGSSTAAPHASTTTSALNGLTLTSDTSPSNASGSKRSARVYEQVRLSHLDEVIHTLDHIVWVELAVVYYLEYVSHCTTERNSEQPLS